MTYVCVYTYRRLQRCLLCAVARVVIFFFFVSFFSFLLFALESFVGGGGGDGGLRLVVFFFFFWKLNYSLRLFEVEEFFFFSKSEISYTGVSLSVKFVEISRKEEKEEERE